MWLIITVLAAVITTAIWYIKAPDDKYKLGLLSLLFWGAALMWFVDHVMAYVLEGGEFIEMNQDAALLGLAVVVFALLVWVLVLLASDPKGIFGKVLNPKR